MKGLFFSVFLLISIKLSFAQVEFYDATSQILGDEVLKSTICIGFNDLNGDFQDDLFLLDEGKTLKTFIQGAPNQSFDYKEHLQISVNGDWAFISGDLDNDGIPEIISSGNEFGSQFYKLKGDLYEKQFGTPKIFSQNSNLVDINNDGFLDFFVCNDDGESLTFINDGNGEMTQTKIIDFQTSPEDDMSGNYSSIFTDIDGDDDLDLYIGKCRANVTDPTDPRRINTLYINNGDGTYTERGKEFGLDIGAQSWSVDSGDVDNDGDNDIIVANHDGPHDLMLNDGNGKFVRKTLIPDGYSSYAFQSYFYDFDNNGWLDIIFTDPSNTFILYNDEMSFSRRDVFDSGRKAFSVATGDLNSDGFPDLYFGFANSFQQVSDINDKVLLNTTNDNNYLTLKLIGDISNRDAIGAKITLYQGEQIKTREIVVGKSYGIMNSTIVHFGLGQSSDVDSIKIKWPSGLETLIDQIKEVNTLLIVNENDCIASRIDMPNIQLCDGQPVEVSLPDGYDTYTWSNGANDQIIEISEVGWYQAAMRTSECIIYTTFFEVTEELQLTQEEILPEIDFVLCEGDNVKLSAYPGISYEWSNGESSRVIEVMESGIYHVTVNTNCNSYVSDGIRVEVAESIMPIVENDTVFFGESATLIGDSENLNWYQNKNDLEPLFSGMSFETPMLFESQTYYIGEVNSGFGLNQSLMNNVPLNNVGDSIYSQNDFVEFEIFNDLNINSLKVRTQRAGERKFVVLNEGVEVISLFIDLGVGVNEIDLNYHFSPGRYKIGTDETVNQNNLGTPHPQLSYSEVYAEKDKRIDGYLEVFDSEIYDGISPYFFSWDVNYGYFECEPRFPVHVVVKAPVFTSDLTPHSIIFPNPSPGEIYVQTDMNLPYYIDVFDISGARVMDRIKVDKAEELIDLRENKGMYFLKLTNDMGSEVKKVYVY